jgi:methylenetetrahydrofolate dehydrogenase (NADP+) / methenyltetrahydrofolate cyclohydrolase
MRYLEGKGIANEMKDELCLLVSKMDSKPRLAIVIVGANAVSEKFVSLKEKFARDIGVETKRYEFGEDITTSELRDRMKDIVHESRNTGIIVQLPLPPQIDSQSILNAVIPEKDIDMLSARSVGDFHVGKARIQPPVVAAIRTLFERNDISIIGMKLAIIGYGRLVGQPVAIWGMRSKATVTVFSDKRHITQECMRDADIIITGVGSPRLIKGDFVKEGVIIVDVGTSEEGGKLVGDVNTESVSSIAAAITPTHGGVGPLTVAFVFQNLLTLSKS